MIKFYYQNGYTNELEDIYPDLFSVQEIQMPTRKDYYFTEEYDFDNFFRKIPDICFAFQKKILPDPLNQDLLFTWSPIFMNQSGLSSDSHLSI